MDEIEIGLSLCLSLVPFNSLYRGKMARTRKFKSRGRCVGCKLKLPHPEGPSQCKRLLSARKAHRAKIEKEKARILETSRQGASSESRGLSDICDLLIEIKGMLLELLNRP